MSISFDPSKYGAEVADLIQSADLCELGPGTPNLDSADRLGQLDQQSLFPTPIEDSDMAACCLSGLWLLHNFLDASHRISQDIHSSTGSYWHAIMHRREPDYSNSKYWFHRVGDHPIFPAISAAARNLAAEALLDDATNYFAVQTAWDAFRFVDVCEAASSGHASSQRCRDIARLEWQILFDYCYQRATSN